MPPQSACGDLRRTSQARAGRHKGCNATTQLPSPLPPSRVAPVQIWSISSLNATTRARLEAVARCDGHLLDAARAHPSGLVRLCEAKAADNDASGAGRQSGRERGNQNAYSFLAECPKGPCSPPPKGRAAAGAGVTAVGGVAEKAARQLPTTTQRATARARRRSPGAASIRASHVASH